MTIEMLRLLMLAIGFILLMTGIILGVLLSTKELHEETVERYFSMGIVALIGGALIILSSISTYGAILGTTFAMCTGWFLFFGNWE